MRNFKPDEYKLFTQLCQMSQEQLLKILSATLKKANYKTIETNAYIAAEGNIPICLVAHLDTVFKFQPAEFYYDRVQNVMWSPDGLGADDRAGVFAILQIIRSGLRPHILFTTDEEVGGLGALQAALAGCPFADVRYFIELDRQGAIDCVFYDCENKRFESYIESFGFVTARGSFSDISIICPEWEIAGVNLSVGYMYEHTFTEILNVGHLLSTINKVKRMLTVKTYPKKFVYVPSLSSKWYKYTTYFDDDIKVCACCQNEFFPEEMIKIKGKEGTLYYCFECIEDHASWCDSCSNLFEKDEVENICPECRKDFKF